MAHWRSFLLLLLAGWAGGCLSPGEGGKAGGAWRIINGIPDTNPAHYAVVELDYFVGQQGWMCSGTLISSDVVLTAGHCCFDASASAYTVYFGPDYQHFTNQQPVSVLLEHPQYKALPDGSTINDICLLRLASPVPPAILPLPYLPASLGLTDTDIGAPLELVGFGQDQNGNTGTKLTITNPLGVVCEDQNGCDFGDGGVANYHTIGYSEAGGGTCFGDSGGPAFITRSGTQYVAGIASYVDGNCHYYGVDTTVNDFEGFVDDFVNGVNGIACSDPSQCNSKNCARGVCCDSPCTDPCMSCGLAGFVGSCHQDPDGAPCPDGDKCNGDETCQAGTCNAGTPLNCTSADPCQVGSCDPGRGCVLAPAQNGTNCSDDNVCNGMETCQNGACRPGQPLDCNDGNACTNDKCDPDTGCAHELVADGTDCGGGMCGQAACKGGQCQYANPEVCDDHDPCTADRCDAKTGCSHQWLADGEKCGNCKVCQSHLCVDQPKCSTGGSGCATTGGEGGPEGLGLALLLLLILIGLARARLGTQQS